jgi:hypothetical protein
VVLCQVSNYSRDAQHDEHRCHRGAVHQQSDASIAQFDIPINTSKNAQLRVDARGMEARTRPMMAKRST